MKRRVMRVRRYAMRLVATANHLVDPIDAPAMIGRDYPPNRRFFSTESSPPLDG